MAGAQEKSPKRMTKVQVLFTDDEIQRLETYRRSLEHETIPSRADAIRTLFFRCLDAWETKSTKRK